MDIVIGIIMGKRTIKSQQCHVELKSYQEQNQIIIPQSIRNG
jgi:hypothetical protein